MLTRFRLQLATFEDDEQVRELRADVDEMQHMLEDYLAFVRGDGDEASADIDLHKFLTKVKQDVHVASDKIKIIADKGVKFRAKPNAFKRCIGNLVSNASRFGENVVVTARSDERYLTIAVEDDGPGVPPEAREDIFRPFFRIDDARNQDEGGSGLGLAIALDIARSHGGDIMLGDSEMGGLKAVVRIPL